jgi:sterol 24-C-methyltransferase
MTDKWDPSNPEHKAVAHGIEVSLSQPSELVWSQVGDGIAEMRPFEAARKAIKSVGFEVLHEEDLADRDDKVKWFTPLEGNIFKAQTLWDGEWSVQIRLIPVFTVWRMSRMGSFVTQNALWGIEKVGLVPKGTYDVGESLIKAQHALVKGGQTKLFTWVTPHQSLHNTNTSPMAMWVCKKPEN